MSSTSLDLRPTPPVSAYLDGAATADAHPEAAHLGPWLRHLAAALPGHRSSLPLMRAALCRAALDAEFRAALMGRLSELDAAITEAAAAAEGRTAITV